MSDARITLLESHNERLRSWLSSDPDGRERAAIVLFRSFSRSVAGQPDSERFVSFDVLELDNDWVVESTATSIRVNLRKFSDLYFRCEQESLHLAFAHSHPAGARGFSRQDDVNEQNILHGYSGSNGPEVRLIALIHVDDQWLARVRHASSPTEPHNVRHVLCLGSHLSVHLQQDAGGDPATLTRQAAAFGKPFNQKLQSLRVVVVGCGGTGSPLATLAARAGVGELILIDGDSLEATNLNRVRGFKAADVGSNKAEKLQAYIESLGLPTAVSAVGHYLESHSDAMRALASADIVFGCTDTVESRDILNEAIYYYGIILLDTGLTGRIEEDAHGQPQLIEHRGRISIVQPEVGACLRCQGVVTDEKIRYESAIKQNPELKKLDADTLFREHYLIGGGEPAPGVGPFTSATADLAVATLFNLIRSFRKLSDEFLQDNIWQDFVHLNFYSNYAKSLTGDCYCCGTRQLLMKREENYYLDRPYLGEIT